MRTIFAVAALALLTVAPASAKMTCSSADMTKATSMLAGMPDGEQKMALQKEFDSAHQAWVKGDMRACNKSMASMEKMSTAKQKE